jgi:hypothetical protein
MILKGFAFMGLIIGFILFVIGLLSVYIILADASKGPCVIDGLMCLDRSSSLTLSVLGVIMPAFARVVLMSGCGSLLIMAQ